MTKWLLVIGLLSFTLWDQLTYRILHDDAITCHWFIIIGWYFDMTHDCGHVVYVFGTWLIVMSHGFHACDPRGTWLVWWVMIGWKLWCRWLAWVSWWISHYNSLWVMSRVMRRYESRRVRVEGRTPLKGHPRDKAFWFSTYPAIEISTPWEFIVNIHHPRTLGELHLHSPWAAPPPSRLTSLIMSLVLRVAGMVTYDTGLGLILEWFYSWRILSRKARSKV